MEFFGKVHDVALDFVSGNYIISFEAEQINEQELEALRYLDKLKVKANKYRQKRSLDANSYYWSLVGKLADCLEISKPHCHNLMLRRYGQVEFFEDRIAYFMLPDTEETTHRMEQMEESHFAPTAQVTKGKDGINYRAWKLLKPSHRYDSKEFSILINGLVDEAKHMGIETIPKGELERMMTEYGIRNP